MKPQGGWATTADYTLVICVIVAFVFDCVEKNNSSQIRPAH